MFFVPLEFESLPVEEQLARALEFETHMQTRRSVRHFSSRAVPRELIDAALRVASRAHLAPISSRGDSSWFPLQRSSGRCASPRKRKRKTTMNADSLKSGWMPWLLWRRTGTKSFWKLLRG